MLKKLSILAAAVATAGALYTGKFESSVWTHDETMKIGENDRISFVVALEMKNVDQMHEHFLQVSNPKSTSYGKFVSLSEIDDMYGPNPAHRDNVISYLSSIEDAEVNFGPYSDLIEVVAPVTAVESHFKTKLSWVTDSRKYTDKRSLRARTELEVPKHLHDAISFISLNSPINHLLPRGTRSRKLRERLLKSNMETAEEKVASISIVAGNEQALVQFPAYCGDGSLNTANPPCSNLPATDAPVFTFSVTEHFNSASNPYQLDTDPTTFTVKASGVYCYNNFFHTTCDGTDGLNCTCVAKLSPLSKYTQLRVNISASFPSIAVPSTMVIGATNLFALTDVATAAFLSDLYSMPPGISVRHGSNQSVVEFYHEFYSNSDLMAFFQLSGLPNATIPNENVLGDLPNNQSKPGGEAQLDVEYIMALAPGADTYFYSFLDYNPNDPVNNTYNEGFLSYLLYVANETYPPLVHSLSYGDIEADIFNVSHNGSVAYGTRCDIEFMKMGLRGLTVVFSSGDDGIGGSDIREDQEYACSKAFPAWPASSPYVTTVGATQMTDKYLPACGANYAPPTTIPDLPQINQLNFECTGVGETVCTGAFGGVITSGGGFSEVNDRAKYAPWQEEVVNYYLRAANSANYPPLSYFNSSGRGYPDVSTYGSNYFVYLDGRITRESGTSASAPVFAAMVTLWNDMRLAYGQSPMGFIAPFLYYAYSTNPDAFQDVVVGNNACGVGSSIETISCCEYSFSATPGWDASTGLGTPNFEILSNLVLNNATYFANLGAYPNGVSQQVTVESSSTDDDSADEHAKVGVIIGIVALILTLITISVFVYCYFFKPKRGGDANQSLIN